MGTDYMELFHEAINNLRVATGNDNIAIDDKWINPFALMA